MVFVKNKPFFVVFETRITKIKSSRYFNSFDLISNVLYNKNNRGDIMDNNKQTCCHLGTTEQQNTLNKLLMKSKKENWPVIKVLEKIQDIYGYLPRPVLEEYSLVHEVPLNKIYGVATFYAAFSLKPKGKFVISVCLGTACYVNGSALILEKFCHDLNIKPGECTPDGMFSIDETRCLGCCGIGPVVLINDEVFRCVKVGEVEGIIASCKGGKK